MPDDELPSGTTPTLTGRVLLGRYRVVRPLAKGGMGVVYLGRVEGAAGFAKPVVIKSVASGLDGDPEGEQLFAREARIVSNLQHPNIVSVIDFGKVDASYVMVLEYVHGYHIGQWLRFLNRKGERVAAPHAVHAVLCVLDALKFAHGLARPDGSAFGIVHRDVSPGNVLVDVQGHVKLSDFGIARSADDEYKTQHGTFRGTLGFSAPEAFAGAPPSPALDQYAAAVVLYQLLAGTNPFRGNQPPETIARIMSLVPPALGSIRDDVPPAIDAAIARALLKKPEDRFPSIAEFAQALHAGATWSARESAETFAARIHADFADGELADTLGLESLAVRDASWREAQATSERPVALSSYPAKVAPDSLPSTVRAGPDRIAPGAPEPAVDSRVTRESTTPRERKSGLLAVVVLALGAALAGLILFVPRHPPVSGVVVVEARETTPAAAVAPPVPEGTAMPVDTATAVGESASASAPSAKASPGRAPVAAPSGDRGALLARAFQRQGGKIQGCFQQHSADGDAQVPISVRFQIDSAGSVQRAQILPSSVAASPLGACLATIAQGTAFGPQPEGLSFAIPISARVVRR